MMNSSQQDSMPPPPHPKTKKDNNEGKNVADDEIIVGVEVEVEVEEGQVMLRDSKTGGDAEEGQIVLLRDPKTGKSVPEAPITTLEEEDGSDIEKEDIVDDDEDANDDEDTTMDEKKDTIDEKDGSDIKMKDIIVELVDACASGRPSRRSKIDAEHKMAAAVKKEESDDEDTDDDDDDDDNKDMMDYDSESGQKISGKDENEEEEEDDAIVKKESEGVNGNKKRKQTKVKDSVKTKNHDIKKDEQDWEPVEEKPKKRARVSESVVKDSAEKMFAKLVQNYQDGITETPMDILASSITTKAGKPYKNHRSDAIQEGMKLLKAQGRAEKTKGNLGVARLLQSEIDKIPKEKISTNPHQVVKQRKAQFLVSLENCPKGGSGETITDAATIVWNKLLDGKAYTRKELVADTSYKAANSTGFEGIMKVLTQLQFVEGKGKCSFSDKIFPHGRPT